MTGMGRSLPKGKMILLPYKASIYYGMPALVKNTDTHEILEQITSDFERMKEKYQVIGEVRGLGSMIGLEFVKDRETKEPAPEMVKEIINSCFEEGIILINAGLLGNVIRFLPPLVMTIEQAEYGMDVLDKEISKIAK